MAVHRCTFRSTHSRIILNSKAPESNANHPSSSFSPLRSFQQFVPREGYRKKIVPIFPIGLRERGTRTKNEATRSPRGTTMNLWGRRSTREEKITALTIRAASDKEEHTGAE